MSLFRRRRRTIALLSVAATIALAGCGKVFENREDGANVQAERDLPPNAGVPAAATAIVAPDGKNLVVLALSSIQPLRTTTVHASADANAILIQAELRSESSEYSAVHVREIENGAPAGGVFTVDSALGCRYSMGNAGTPLAHVASLSGSCVNALTVALPDHEIPRTYLGTRPLFSGEIPLADLKVVYAAAGFDPKTVELLRTYVARLPVDAKPLAVADVAAFLPQLGNDARRLDAVALLAPRVSDAANAEALPKEAFASPAARANAVRILAAFAAR